MLPQRFFWTSFFSFIAVILISSLLFGGLLYTHFRDTTLSNLEEGLKKQTEVLANVLQANPRWLDEPDVVSGLIHTNDRITVMKLDGTVVIDNWAKRLGVQEIENHSGRPEFRAALKDSPVFQTRFSETVNTEMLYYAIPLRQEGRVIAVLRLSHPLSTYYSQLADIRNYLILIGLLAVFLSLPFAWILSRGTTRSIEDLRNSAGRIAAGDLSHRAPLAGSLEFRELGRDFNLMAEELQKTISSIQSEYEQRETLLATMVEGVLALDHHGKATYANEAFCKIVGSHMERIRGRSFLEISRSDDLSEYITNLLKPAVHPFPSEPRELRLQSPEGELIFAVQASRIHKDSDNPTSLLLVFHDITGTKRLEQIRRDFVANVSHELRTPLTAIRGSIEILLDGAYRNEPECRKFLEIMDKQLRNIQNIITDMLKLASVEEVRIPTRREIIELGVLVGDVIAIVRPLAERKSQNLIVNLPDSPLEISVDPVQISDSLMNLLDNAVKYTQPGGTIRLAVALEQNQIVFRVEDNGPGIPGDQLPRIFERFYRVDKSRSREMGGTGLGLSIVKHAVENHGGVLSAESEPGRGSAFTIRLPLVAIPSGTV